MYARKKTTKPTYNAANGMLKAILVRAQKKGRYTERASILQNTKVFMNRILVKYE